MREQIKLYINNYDVDTTGIDSVSLKIQIKDVKEFSKRKTSFSKPIKVLQTKRNVAMFEELFNINKVGGFDRNGRYDAKLAVNGQTVLEGILKLTSISKEYYEVVLFKDNVNLQVLFGDELIKGNKDTSKDLNIPSSPIYPTRQLMLDEFYNRQPHPFTGEGIFFGCSLMRFNNIEGITYNKNEILMPALCCMELLENLMIEADRTITFSPLVRRYLTRMYVPFNGDYRNLCTEWDFADYRIDTLYPLAIATDYPLNIKPWRDYYAIKDDITETINTHVGNSIPLPAAGKYKITLDVILGRNAGTEIPSVKPKVAVIKKGEYNGSIIDVELDGDPVELTSYTETYPATWTGYFECTQFDNEIFIGDVNRNLAGGSILEVQGNIRITKIDGYYSGNKAVYKNDVLPLNYKKKAFFDDIITMFNAMVTEENGVIHIETWEEWLKSSTVTRDWSSKIDADSVTIKTISSQKSSVDTFSFSSADTFFTKDFFDQTGSRIYDYTPAAARGKATNNIKLTSATPHSIGGYLDATNKDGKFSFKSKPRICFADYEYTSPTGGALGLPIYTSRFIYYFDEIENPNNVVMAWAVEKSYEKTSPIVECKTTLYDKFYKGYGYEDDSLILLTAKLKLTASDIAELSLRDTIYLNTAKFGSGLFKINLIDGFKSGASELTKVEFAQIKPETWIDPEFGTKELEHFDLTLENEEKNVEFSKASGNSEGTSNSTNKSDVEGIIKDYIESKEQEGVVRLFVSGAEISMNGVRFLSLQSTSGAEISLGQGYDGQIVTIFNRSLQYSLTVRYILGADLTIAGGECVQMIYCTDSRANPTNSGDSWVKVGQNTWT